MTLKQALEDIRKRHIIAALRRTRGNRTRAAKQLGYSRQRLQIDIDRLKIAIPPLPPGRPKGT